MTEAELYDFGRRQRLPFCVSAAYGGLFIDRRGLAGMAESGWAQPTEAIENDSSFAGGKCAYRW